MPVKYIHPEQQEHPELINELARVLRENKSEGPANEPEIRIEEIRHSRSLHVTVIWDRWVNIDPEERGRIILEAFTRERGEQEGLRVTLAMGATREEARRLGLINGDQQ